MEISGAAFEDRTSGLPRALGWFRHLQGFGYDAIPFFAVHDVGHLLVLGDAFPFKAVTDLDQWSEDERPLRLAWENRFLNALRADAKVRRLVHLVSQFSHETEKADVRVRRALEILFAPLRMSPLAENFAINPAQLRDFAEVGALDAGRAKRDFERKHPHALLALLGAFVARAAASVEIPRLLHEEDFFELTHFEALDRPHRRLFARRVEELVTAAGPIDLARTGVKVESQEAATLVQDEGTYPTGGIGEITTHGSIENLVRSELVYRDDNAEVDLFALRWSEGDLLFYTRDSGALHRKRRTLVFVIEPSRLRVKDPRHANSRAVLAYALIARCYEDMRELFGGEGARADLRIVAAHASAKASDAVSAEDADQEEAALFRLRLREAARRGDAAVRVENPLDPATLVDPRRRTFVVTIGDVEVDEAFVAGAGGTILRVALEAGADTEKALHLDPAAIDAGEAIAAVRDVVVARVVGVR